MGVINYSFNLNILPKMSYSVLECDCYVTEFHAYDFVIKRGHYLCWMLYVCEMYFIIVLICTFLTTSWAGFHVFIGYSVVLLCCDWQFICIFCPFLLWDVCLFLTDYRCFLHILILQILILCQLYLFQTPFQSVGCTWAF